MTKKDQFQLNKDIEAFIAEKKKDKSKFSPVDIRYINQYTGMGGLTAVGASGKGILSEYYTPPDLCERMVSLAYKHGYDGGQVVEPSCGTGHFLQYFDPQIELTAFEINPTAAAIAQLNYPTFKIKNNYFNSFFTDRTGTQLNYNLPTQLVIGNPPYGVFTGKYSVAEKKATGASKYEQYFILRGLDLLVKDGLLIYVVPSSVLNGPVSKFSKVVLAKATLIDAYRLPVNTFKQTSIGTDILVFQKRKS